jgi:hypothetical protein
MDPAEAVAVFHRAPISPATPVDQYAAVGVVLLRHDQGSRVRFLAHVENVVSAKVDDAMFSTRHNRVSLD